MADCALLDRGLQRQRRVFRGMEPLFRVHYACEWAGEDGGGRLLVLLAPLAPSSRHRGEKASSSDVFSRSGINEILKG